MIVPKIQENSRYLEDIQKFLKAIENVNNEKTKFEAVNILGKLINEIKYIDSFQESLVFSKPNKTTSTKESRKNIIAYRKQLDKLLHNYFE